MAERKVKIFTRFERFWHWTQALLIVTLMFSGLGVHGLHHMLYFGQAVTIHTIAALCLIALWVFAIFWHLTTGTWRHYVPDIGGLWPIIRYYAYGVFKCEDHPYHKGFWRKHNPLQVLAYLGLKLVLFPTMWITGITYLTYEFWQSTPNASAKLELVASLHLIAGYMIVSFVLIHVYLLTVGHFFEHVRPMITGVDTIDLTPEEEAYLETSEPHRLKG